MPLVNYLIAALLVTNLVTGVLWRFAAHEVDKLELMAEVSAAENARVVKEQEQITEDVRNGWKAALDVTRADWSRRLRNANVQPMPGISGPAGGVDGLPADALALGSQCAETTLMLRDLQTWAKRQGKVQ
ncbi:MAG: hypothetical protein A2Y38_14730 [Spirochaetes bacterium GWB1_59_5]|nr:MAG: hypothetical protein A2Y38_14730 [Spirochaetes bacterium GWB1_59_5]